MEFQDWMFDSYIETALYDYQAGPVNEFQTHDVFGRPQYPELTPAPYND
jgi:hypothetical protein